MKKIFSVMAGLVVATAMMAQEPVITFEKDNHDFGKINEADGRVTTVFNFKNEGPAPLVLSNVRASCGCTTPKWTHEPIEPGATGNITVTYNPSGRPGKFKKTITVTSNASEPTKKLYIEGEVIPKPVTPVVSYPVKIGELSLSTKTIDFGTIKKGQVVTRNIEYANQTDNTITVQASQLSWLNTQVSLNEVPTNTTGQLIAQLDTRNLSTYGPISATICLAVNGKEMKEETNLIIIKANIVEDFSTWTDDQKLKAPIFEVEKEINLGTLVAGKKYVRSIHFKNAGSSPLYVRRVVASNGLIFPEYKSAFKAGEREMRFTIDTSKMQKSQTDCTITIITNDPNHSVQTVHLVWEVK